MTRVPPPALERTYLAYYRTSLVFAMLAAINAQLTVLQHSPSPSSGGLSFQSLGKPLSIALVCFSIAIALLGGVRWWRLQSGLIRGFALSGGVEVWGLAGGVGVVGYLPSMIRGGFVPLTFGRVDTRGGVRAVARGGRCG
jgi:uncharacterized membrane protein YidH (DUF202 family)